MEAYWTFSANDAGKSLILPDGRCDIILRYNIFKADLPIPIITGPATRPYTVEYDAGDSWLGMRLRPDNGVSVWSREIFHAADTVLRGEDAIALLPALEELKGIKLTLNHFSSALESKVLRKADSRLSLALNALHTSGGRMRIDTLALLVGCSSRQLNRMFRSSSGLSTKTYAQLVQFHRTLKLIDVEQLSISDAAFEGGYSDHAHLARAFQRFGGFTPSNVPDGLSLPSIFS